MAIFTMTCSFNIGNDSQSMMFTERLINQLFCLRTLFERMRRALYTNWG